MANPLSVPCAIDTWVKVATAVQYGRMWIANIKPSSYLWTYRETGGAAPTTIDDGMPVTGLEVEIDHSTAIDVYIYARNAAGEVELWL